MLLTDNSVLTTADLERCESDIVATATTAKVSLDNKLWQAALDIRAELAAKLPTPSFSSGGITDPVIAWHTGQYNGNIRVRLEQVVVDERLKLWLTRRAMYLTYLDLMTTKNGERYEAKLDHWQGQEQSARDSYFSVGLLFVIRPLERPAQPALSETAGGALAARVYDVQIKWVDADGTSSAPSVALSATVAVNKLLTVSIASLTPPSGTSPADGQTFYTPGKATSWAVYAAAAGSTPQLQATIAIGTTSWTEPTGGLIAGATPSDGQLPNGFLPIVNMVQRG